MEATALSSTRRGLLVRAFGATLVLRGLRFVSAAALAIAAAPAAAPRGRAPAADRRDRAALVAGVSFAPCLTSSRAPPSRGRSPPRRRAAPRRRRRSARPPP